MLAPSMTKFGFRIRTRVGVMVDNLVIQARDEAEAQRKLRQMYHGCEVIECARQCDTVRMHVPTFEEVAGLITR